MPAASAAAAASATGRALAGVAPLATSARVVAETMSARETLTVAMPA